MVKAEGPGIDPRSCHWEFFSEDCALVDSASKNECQDIRVPSVMKSGSLNLLDTSRPRRPVTGILHP